MAVRTLASDIVSFGCRQFCTWLCTWLTLCTGLRHVAMGSLLLLCRWLTLCSVTTGADCSNVRLLDAVMPGCLQLSYSTTQQSLATQSSTHRQRNPSPCSLAQQRDAQSIERHVHVCYTLRWTGPARALDELYKQTQVFRVTQALQQWLQQLAGLPLLL